MKKENLLIEPERKHTRKDLYGMILMGILIMAFIEIFHSTPFTNFFFYGILLIMVILILTRNIYQKFEIDYLNSRVNIEYITLFKSNCERMVPFDELHYEYRKIASRSGAKWTLKLWQNDKKVLSLVEGDWGFNKEKIDLLVEKLEEL